jgi:alkyldihydroxyacetonephosphate synthase
VSQANPSEGAIRSALDAIVGAAHVQDQADALAALGVSVERAPAWLVAPGSAAEVSELISLASRHAIAVIPVGKAGRAPRTGALEDRMRLFIDTRRMNHVLHLDETSLIVHVQTGLTGLALEAILSPRKLSLGDYPPAVLGSTMGGLLSVRTPGKSSARHGFVEDAVLGLSAVLSDGRSIHTRVAPRRATGPDLARALCGSEGTLGFITSVVLRIHRLPEARFLAAYALPDFNAALSTVYLALREEAAPAALRAYDGEEAGAHLGADVCTRDEAVLVAATAGPTDLAACDRDLIASVAAAMGARALPESVAEIWWRRRMGRELAGQPGAALLPVLQVTAAPSRQKAVYGAVRSAAREAGTSARAHASRFDHDGAVLFFSFTDRAGDAMLEGEELTRVRAAAERAARRAGAVLLDSSNPSLDPYLDELRRILDPRDIMNPGALRG